MKKSYLITAIVAGVLLLFCLGGGVTACSAYNNMVAKSEAVDKTWADVQSQYQRRFDMIPNLVSTVKGYAKHEKSTLAEVTAMRAGDVDKAGDQLLAEAQASQSFGGPDAKAPSPAQLQKLDRALSVYINAVHEAYPQLQASQNFMDLQKQIEGTENRINLARDRYNESVQGYNVYIKRFPNNLFAGMFGFGDKQMFAASSEAQNAVQVSFDDM